MSDESPKLKLPGIEFGYPTTLPGAMAVVAVSAALSISFYHFLTESPDGLVRDVTHAALGIEEKANQQAQALESFRVRDGKLESEIRELTQRLEISVEVIKEAKKREEKLLAVVSDVDRGRPDELHGLMNASMQGGAKANDFVEMASRASAHAEQLIQSRPSELSESERLENLAESELPKAIVEHFLTKKSWLNRYYRMSAAQVFADDPRGMGTQHGPEGIEAALDRLVGAGVLRIREGKGVVYYELDHNSEALKKFRAVAHI